jgi:uncharacterized protein YjeT (DUF2065 family)
MAALGMILLPKVAARMVATLSLLPKMAAPGTILLPKVAARMAATLSLLPKMAAPGTILLPKVAARMAAASTSPLTSTNGTVSLTSDSRSLRADA